MVVVYLMDPLVKMIGLVTLKLQIYQELLILRKVLLSLLIIDKYQIMLIQILERHLHLQLELRELLSLLIMALLEDINLTIKI